MARTRGFGDIRVSPRNQKIMKWLRRKPTPALVVGETVDGEERRAVVSLTGPTIWADVISVVRPCIRLEAKDKDGNTLRALELDPDEPELQAEAESEAEEHMRRGGYSNAVPLISVDIPKLVDNLARNMREVSAQAAAAQSNSFKEGFTAMTNVVNLCLNMLMRIEERLNDAEDRATQLQLQTQAPQAEPTDQRQQLAMMALQRAMGGAMGGAPSNGAPNGGGFDMAKLMALFQTLQAQQPPEHETDDGN